MAKPKKEFIVIEVLARVEFHSRTDRRLAIKRLKEKLAAVKQEAGLVSNMGFIFKVLPASIRVTETNVQIEKPKRI